ncbi:gliding motility protein GldM [Capnocytophaga cynodegmi]|uniref:Gliding motility-associated protein GldM n=1 Tax=Capnocytophaga cynodegmi TaxID=28189 RepID=A0A0B7HJL8_9FLAO|nr:gliding motility protein GldM [Capnocytophaga cynodegmi]GIM54788.1 gliding motility protein GldM [Capnocytophaga cynodegmi]CEN38844.1 Gliding motility-associated protein GldM [Capnocytophaga cynodegmi]
MAGGKLSPRQRMINLMYLVFIAMLALNMGKEVLNAFGLVNDKFEASNIKANEDNLAAMQALQEKVNENGALWKESHEKAKLIKETSDGFYNHIQQIKGGLNEEVEKARDPKTGKIDYQKLDKSEYTDGIFFKGEGYADGGKKFIEAIEAYKKSMAEILGNDPKYKSIVDKINREFSTADEKKTDGTTQKWLNYNFEGFPYVASLAKLSMMQSDVRSVEQNFYEAALSGALKQQVSMTNYTTLLEQSKGAYYQGEKFDGAIVLGRKDATTRPNSVELKLDGRTLSPSDYTIEDGRVKLNVGAGNAGEHKITGSLHFDQDGERISVPVEQSFSTIPKPNSAVISADKMNVVYRGVSNPITISMPGVPNNKISASGAGLSRSGNGWVMNPGTGREVTINVSGEIDGQKFSSSRLFRIKNIPRPLASIGGQVESVKLPKSNLGAATITAKFEDFDFDLNTKITSFKVSIPGQPTISVQGNKMNDQVRNALNRARKGDIVNIFDVKAAIVGNSDYKMPTVIPINVEITN